MMPPKQWVKVEVVDGQLNVTSNLGMTEAIGLLEAGKFTYLNCACNGPAPRPPSEDEPLAAAAPRRLFQPRNVA
jgi:hypothetical protein